MSETKAPVKRRTTKKADVPVATLGFVPRDNLVANRSVGKSISETVSNAADLFKNASKTGNKTLMLICEEIDSVRAIGHTESIAKLMGMGYTAEGAVTLMESYKSE